MVAGILEKSSRVRVACSFLFGISTPKNNFQQPAVCGLETKMQPRPRGRASPQAPLGAFCAKQIVGFRAGAKSLLLVSSKLIKVSAFSRFNCHRQLKTRRRDEETEIGYFTSTVAPASVNFFLMFSASSLETPSLMGLGALSTKSLASFKPKLVTSRTALITLILLAPTSFSTTLNSVFSSAGAAPAVAPAPPPAIITGAAAAAETPRRSSSFLTRAAASSNDNPTICSSNCCRSAMSMSPVFELLVLPIRHQRPSFQCDQVLAAAPDSLPARNRATLSC